MHRQTEIEFSRQKKGKQNDNAGTEHFKAKRILLKGSLSSGSPYGWTTSVGV